MEVINFFANFGREESALHDMGGKSSGDRVNEGETTSKGKKVSFPTRQFSTELINDEVVHPFVVLVNEDGGAKIFAKISCEGKAKLILNHLNVVGGNAGREENSGFKVINFLTGGKVKSV